MELRGFNPPRAGGLKLHLGCGRTILGDGWTNVDSVKLPGVDLVADLDSCRTTPLPFADDSVDEFFMSHLIEHIRDTIGMMQELHRIAKPGAILVSRCPYGSSDDAWEDPTHVRPMFLQSWGYFSQPFYWNKDYLYRGDWQPEQVDLLVDDSYAMRNWRGRLGKDPDRVQMLNMLFTERNFVREMVATLRCVKPIREPKKELQALPQINFVPV